RGGLGLRHLDVEVSELLAGVELQLVGGFHGDGYHVAGGEFLFHTALDGGGAHFVGRGGLAVHQFTADDERGFAALDKNDVGLSGVIFGFARAFAVGHIEGVVGVAAEYLGGDFFVVHLGRQGFA